MHTPVSPAGGELNIVLASGAGKLVVQTVNREGQPYPSVRLLLGKEPLPSSPWFGELQPHVTDQNGEAVFEGLAPGE